MQGLGTALRSISRGKSPSQDRDRSGLCVGRRFLPQARGLRMKEARGIYRVRRIGGLGSDARVTDGTQRLCFSRLPQFLMLHHCLRCPLRRSGAH